MAQSISKVWLHVVYSTKQRRPFLQEKDFRIQMFKMLAHQINELGCVSASVGGHVDHIHLLVGLTRTITIAKLVESIKTETSKWAKEFEPLFSWQSGYGAFSVSQSLLDSVDSYIRNQDEHHINRSFQDELRLLCKKHGVELDERYAWG